MTGTYAPYDPASLPAPVLAYLDARDEHRYADAAAVFASDATVLDNGTTHEGIDAITTWIEASSTEYTYSSTRVRQQVADDSHPVVHVRLDGNFPGGTVLLRYQFALHAGLISRLAIEV